MCTENQAGRNTRVAYLGETTSLVPFAPLQWLRGSPVTCFHDVRGGAGGSSPAAGGEASAPLSRQTFYKLLLKPLIHRSDAQFRKISKDLLISAALPSFTLVMS